MDTRIESTRQMQDENLAIITATVYSRPDLEQVQGAQGEGHAEFISLLVDWSREYNEWEAQLPEGHYDGVQGWYECIDEFVENKVTALIGG